MATNRIQTQVFATFGIGQDQLAGPVFDPKLPATLASQLKVVQNELLVMKAQLEAANLKEANNTYGRAGAEFATIIRAYQNYMNNIAGFINAGLFWPKIVTQSIKNALALQTTNITNGAAQLVPASTNYLQTLTDMSQLQQIADGLGDLMESRLKTDYHNSVPPVDHDPAVLAALTAFTDAFRHMALNTPAKKSPDLFFDDRLTADLDNAWTAATTPPPVGLKVAAFMPVQMQNLAFTFDHAGPIAAILKQTMPVNFSLQQRGRRISIGAAITQSRRRFYLLNSIQTILLTLLISLVAYKIFGDAWMGKWTEMLGLFLAAFSMDIATDSVLNLKSKVLT